MEPEAGPSASDSMVVDAPGASSGEADGRLKIGDNVCLDPDFLEHRGVPPGPMGVGDIGVVVDLNPGRVFVEVRGQVRVRSGVSGEQSESKRS